MRAKIFVSYSRKDDDWRQRFQMALGHGVYASKFELWIDKSIEAGRKWREEIGDAIDRSSVALILVSKGFLESDHIHEKELPRLWQRHEIGKLTIFWVPIDSIPEKTLEATKLPEIQAAWPLSKPLSELDEKKELPDALLHIGSNLIQRINLHDETSDTLRGELGGQVANVVPDISLVESFAGGDYSIFFKAKHDDADVVVKALVPSPGQQWLSDGFVKRANTVRRIANSTAIGIRHVYRDEKIPCVIMDYVTAPTLKARLETEHKLSGKLVANVLAQLVRLAGHVHALEGGPIIGPVRPSHVHYDNAREKAFISLIPIASETLETWREDPTRLHTSKTLPYLSPEGYAGKTLDGRTDQYHLGLLALELLRGKSPVKVKAFADLQDKKNFFKSPRSYFEEEFRSNEPAFSFVLAKMLEEDPEHRWESIPELVRALEDIAEDRVPERVSRHAGDQYDCKLWNNMAFFGSFYRGLFERSDAVRALFEQQGVGMRRQYRKLDRAISEAINFALHRRTAPLRPQVDKHRGLGLTAKNFEQFQDAFLEALREMKIEDEYSRDAWRAILGPALAHISGQVGSR